jgi:hypothetical protein
MGGITRRRRECNFIKKYVDFKDEQVKLVCCVSWGDFKKIVTADNGDDTVTITTTFYSMRDTTVKRKRVLSVEVKDNTGGEYTAGTRYEAVGMTRYQMKRVTGVRGGLEKIINSKFVRLTTSFPQDVPLYGLSMTKVLRNSDCSSNFKTENNDTFRLYHYYQYFGYVNGSTGYIGTYDTDYHNFNGYRYYFFGEYDNSRMTGMGYFTGVSGYKPEQFSRVEVYVLTDAEITEETQL